LRYASISVWVGFSGWINWTAGPVTVPLVLGVHASALQLNSSFTGEIMWAESRSFSQPGWPKSHGSRCVFSNPHSFICFTTHSADALWLGDPVSRGPKISVR